MDAMEMASVAVRDADNALDDLTLPFYESDSVKNFMNTTKRNSRSEYGSVLEMHERFPTNELPVEELKRVYPRGKATLTMLKTLKKLLKGGFIRILDQMTMAELQITAIDLINELKTINMDSFLPGLSQLLIGTTRHPGKCKTWGTSKALNWSKEMVQNCISEYECTGGEENKEVGACEMDTTAGTDWKRAIRENVENVENIVDNPNKRRRHS